MNIKKILFLIALLSFLISCKQNNTTACSPILSEDAKSLLGVWQTRFRYSEGVGYQTLPYVSEKVHTYEYVAFSQTGKVHYAVRKVDYKNSEIELMKTRTFDFVAGNGSMKWIDGDVEQMVDFLFDGEVLTLVLRGKDGKLSVYSNQKTTSVLLEDIENAESKS